MWELLDARDRWTTGERQLKLLKQCGTLMVCKFENNYPMTIAAAGWSGYINIAITVDTRVFERLSGQYRCKGNFDTPQLGQETLTRILSVSYPCRLINNSTESDDSNSRGRFKSRIIVYRIIIMVNMHVEFRPIPKRVCKRLHVAVLSMKYMNKHKFKFLHLY